MILLFLGTGQDSFTIKIEQRIVFPVSGVSAGFIVKKITLFNYMTSLVTGFL
jgi:hypothetical protein